MEVPVPESAPSPKARKKRIPKACSSCRQSKVKCDGQRPCLRCRGQKKTCTFTERPKDAHELMIESLANEVETLKARLGTPQGHGDVRPQGPSLDAILNNHPQEVNSSMAPIREREDASIYDPTQSMPSISPLQMTNPDHPNTFDRPQLGSGTDGSPTTTFIPDPRTHKRKRSHFEPGVALLPDFVTAGLLTLDQAKSYFDAFFDGCDRYVPVFDQQYDTLQGVRSRSGLLFSTICTVGCRVLSGTESHQYHLLNFHIKRMLNSVITSPTNASLEAVQALLVRACYVPERSLLVAIATRVALDLGLPEAYDKLCSSLISRGRETEQNSGFFEDGATLIRKTRTWMHLLVLGHILHVDAGDFPTFGFRGDVRRCRILLDSPHSTNLDLRLFSQVELNVLRAKIYDSLSNCANVDDEEIMGMVRDARMDLEIWFNDWMRIVERCKEQLPQLRLNLRIQRCWGVAVAMCRAVRLSGVENVNAMSPTQKNILLMAKDALTEHLIITIEEPRIYLQELRFAMDFVWAKCAFCYLLLLKLSILLPDDNEQLGWDLVEQGSILLAELSKVAGGLVDGARSSTSKLYLQLMQASIAKYRHVLQGGGDIGEGVATGGIETPHQQGTISGIPRTSGQNELESFVPEQFVFEWDFPGLTLFSSPTTEAVWLDEFLLGALNGVEDLYNTGWASVDMGG